MKMPNENNIGDVVKKEDRAQADRDDAFDSARLRDAHKAGEKERQSNR